MRHRRPFTFFATMVHCWFMFNKVSTGTPSWKSHPHDGHGTAIPAEANSMLFPPWSTEKLTALRLRNKLQWLYNFPNCVFNFSADLVLPPQNITKAGRRTGKLGRGNNDCQLDADRNMGNWCGLPLLGTYMHFLLWKILAGFSSRASENSKEQESQPLISYWNLRCFICHLCFSQKSKYSLTEIGTTLPQR